MTHRIKNAKNTQDENRIYKHKPHRVSFNVKDKRGKRHTVSFMTRR